MQFHTDIINEKLLEVYTEVSIASVFHEENFKKINHDHKNLHLKFTYLEKIIKKKTFSLMGYRKHLEKNLTCLLAF